MAVTPTYPGVYVQEVLSGVRTIVGVSTSTTLFIGRTKFGPMNTPVRITTYTDFVRAFGEDGTVSDMSRYVKLFFLNGGSDAYIMRIADGATPASVQLESEAVVPVAVLGLTAKNPGTTGESIRAAVNYNTPFPEATFNMELFRWQIDSSGNRSKVDREEWLNLSMDPTSATYAPTFLSQKSTLVNATDLDAALAHQQHGSSIAGRLVVDNNNPGGTGGFLTVWATLLGGTLPRNSFRISVDGHPAVPVSLTGLSVSTIAGATADAAATNLGNAIADIIQTALGVAGISISAPAVAVTFLRNPGVAAAGDPVTRRMSISSTHFGDLRITSAANPAEDLASVLGLGEVNGGTEPGAHARRRPAANGISLRAGSAAELNDFATIQQDDIDHIRLDELNASGAVVPVDLDVDLTTFGPSTSPMWRDSTGDWRGVREKFTIIRDRVAAEQAAKSSRFFWRAEIWGNRLTFIKNGGEDTVVTPFATLPEAAPGALFVNNVRHYPLGPSSVHPFHAPGASGLDGDAPQPADYEAAYVIVDREVDLFNILVLPPSSGTGTTPLTQLWPAASVFCQKRRAFLVMDDPGWTSSQQASTGVDALRIGLVKDYAALYFPRISIAENGLTRNVGAAGAMAGLYARTDGTRGVWKAPAGTEADVRGITGVDVRISDAENGQVNPVGVNALRVFPDGVVSWGSRTMAGSDMFASEYKYIPVRRTALFIEESLYRGLKWVVFEPNDIALWAQIRLNVGAFMQDLFRKGAFAGAKPSEAYFVKCDAETTTQNDRNLGIVNIWVGFAPLKPAEFVILYLQQMAGQLEAQG